MSQLTAPQSAPKLAHTASDVVPTDPPRPSQHSSALALEALLGRVAFHPLDERGWIRISGEDRVRWLNGMVTNSIQNLAAGDGNYNFILNAQGQIQGEGAIFARTDDLLLETDASQVANLLPLLDRFVIMDDVELAAMTPDRRGLLIAGPRAAALLSQLELTPSTLAELSVHVRSWRGASLDLIHAHSPVVPRFELWADAAVIAQVEQILLDQGIAPANSESLDLLRTLEGTPRFGVDIRGRELPQETGQTRALHFSKGCYLGQEIVERIRSRGKVNRTFTGFVLEGASPSPGTVLSAAEKPIGELTTISVIPPCAPFPDGARLALGYVRREAIDQHLPITYVGGSATPSSLPFPLPAIHP